MINKKLISSSGIAIAIVLLLAINILANVIFKSARLDLTDNNLYTLSDGTKNILGSFEEPITLRFYFSEKLAVSVPQLSSYARRVRELLEEYATESNGMVKLIVADPEPFSDYEDQAVQHGLQGVPIDTAGSTAYFGLVGTNSTDEKEVIRFFQMEKENSLEYDVTKMIHKLGNTQKSVVGLMSSLPLVNNAPVNPMSPIQAPAQDWMIVNQMKQMFDVRNIETDVTSIPKDIDVLMVVHPKKLSDTTLFAIDQFILGGGRLLTFVDPFSEADQPAPDPQNPLAARMAPKDSNLDRLFDKWGIELVKGQLVADIDAASRVSLAQGPRPQAIDYVIWLQLKKDNMSQDDFITAQLNQITMASAGQLNAKAGAETEFTPIIESGIRGMNVATSQIQFQPNPIGLLDNYRPGNNKLAMAARVSGKVKSAFPDGHPNGDKGEWLSESKDAINIIVVADTDILQDKFWVDVQNFFGQRVAVPRANNGAFVVNAIENLSGSNDLISLRSRGNYARPFEKVGDIQREAEKRFRSREKQLQAKLKETESKISELQRQKDSQNSLIMSPAQKQEIAKFRSEQVKTRKLLRNVQHELRKDIEGLGSILKFINIALIPLIIVIFAIALGVYKHRRMDRLATN